MSGAAVQVVSNREAVLPADTEAEREQIVRDRRANYQQRVFW